MKQELSLNQYQELSSSTLTPNADCAEYLLGNLAAEAGECLGQWAKMYRGDFDEKEFRRRLKKELGDVLWQTAQVARYFGLPLEDVAAANLEKLRGRKDHGTIQGDGDDR